MATGKVGGGRQGLCKLYYILCCYDDPWIMDHGVKFYLSSSDKSVLYSNRKIKTIIVAITQFLALNIQSRMASNLVESQHDPLHSDHPVTKFSS